MKVLKIVIVTEVVFPRIAPRAFRATELAKALAAKGHNVTLIASLGKYDYTEFEDKYKVKVKDLGSTGFATKNSDGKINLPLWKKGVIFFLHKLLDFPDILLLNKVKKAVINEGQIDLLISIAVPHSVHWGVSFISKKNKNFTKWVADCGDPYMGSSFSNPMFYFKYFEKKWCEKADYISVPVESAKQAYYEEFHDKIVVIPQGFNFSEIKLNEYVKNTVPTFMYTGFFYPKKRDPSNFLRYLSSLDFNFRFIIYTSNDRLIRKFYSILKEKLIVRDTVSREKLFLEMSKADFLINISNKNSDTQVPSKLIDYSLAKRPILEISSDFTESERKNFDDFLSGDFSSRKIISNLEQYNIVNVSDKFLSLY